MEKKQYQMHPLLAELLREKTRQTPLWQETTLLVNNLNNLTQHDNGHFSDYTIVADILELGLELIKHILDASSLLLANSLCHYLTATGNLSVALTVAKQIEKYCH